MGASAPIIFRTPRCRLPHMCAILGTYGIQLEPKMETSHLLDDPEVYMAKYSAHDGMITPKDSLAIELGVGVLRAVMNRFGTHKYRIGPIPDWSGVRLYPRGTHGFSYNPDDKRGMKGRARTRVSEDSNEWIKSLRPFALSRCKMVVREKYIDILLPEVLYPPHQKNRKKHKFREGELVTAAELEVTDNQCLGPEPTIGVAQQTEAPAPLQATEDRINGVVATGAKPEIFELIDRVNAIKEQFGDSMLITVTNKGFLKVMVEHGSAD